MPRRKRPWRFIESMLTYAIEKRGKTPLYEFLYAAIREDILRGAIAAGERLPSRRKLAEHLRVSAVTVEGAYRQLEAEGYVTVAPRRGVFANPMRHIEANQGDCPNAANSLSAADAQALPVWKLDLASNRIDASHLPAALWARLTRQVLSETPEALTAPAPHQGLPELRAAIAANLRALKGMAVSPEQIVIGAGAEYLYMLLAQFLGGRGTFALENPGYPKIRLVYGKCGVRRAPIPLDDQGLEMDALRASGAAVVHLSPSHQYPTGVVTPIGRRHALLRWAEKNDGFLIEDDYDSEFRFTGRPLPTLQSIDRAGRVIYLNTFSQTLSPALRVGYMALPPRLLEPYRREMGFYACTAPVLEQRVLARFLSGGHYERHIARIRKEYRARRAAVLDAFRNSPFSDQISISEQDAGLHFLLRWNGAESEEAIRAAGRARGVRLRFLSEYAAAPRDIGGPFSHTLVIHYAPLTPERLPEAIRLLAEIFQA